jgi:hypothetical protein
MTTNLDIYKRLCEHNFDKPILGFYKGYFDNCFVVLHPFYRQVFADNYNVLGNFRLTYPLLQKITWEEILKRTGIKSQTKLALTITYPACDRHFRSLVEFERNEFEPFISENNILEPYWAEDKIPEDLIVLFLQLLMKRGYTEIIVGHWPEYADEKMQVVKLTDENKFDNALRFATQNFFLTTDNKYCLKLPYHDLPYTFLLTSEISANEIASELNYEGFPADNKTEVYWHIDK